jgi:lipopolysaccharide export system protein LptC
MDKKLLFILFSIPVISVYLTWSVLDHNEKSTTQTIFPTQDKNQKSADTFFNQATILNFNETGLPKSKIIGKQIFHYPNEEDSEIISPQITLFRETGSPVHITADQGWINHDGTRVILKGHTIIRREQSQTNQFSQLETPELTVWPNKEYAETTEAVKITTKSTIATGIGMEAYLDQAHYYLLNNVKARHIPIKKPK